jgi:hypothetical protein
MSGPIHIDRDNGEFKADPEDPRQMVVALSRTLPAFERKSLI